MTDFDCHVNKIDNKSCVANICTADMCIAFDVKFPNDVADMEGQVQLFESVRISLFARSPLSSAKIHILD
jgi:hypothetical protein